MEKIVDSREVNGEKQFLGKYKGFDNSHNKWLSSKELFNAKELLHDFLNSNNVVAVKGGDNIKDNNKNGISATTSYFNKFNDVDHDIVPNNFDDFHSNKFIIERIVEVKKTRRGSLFQVALPDCGPNDYIWNR